MIVMNVNDKEEIRIESFPYKEKKYEVKETYIRWLSQVGPKGSDPEYGLRFFTLGIKGEIPIHNHFYHQTIFVLEGELVATSYFLETDEIIEERKLARHDSVFIPSLEPHRIQNLSETDNATFLCCIANVYEEE